MVGSNPPSRIKKMEEREEINRGIIKNGKYIKYINPSEAVLWKTRELSLRPDILTMIMQRGVKEMIFINKKTYFGWVFNTDKVIDKMKLKRVGQEPQYYFSIDLREDFEEEERV